LSQQARQQAQGAEIAIHGDHARSTARHVQGGRAHSHAEIRHQGRWSRCGQQAVAALLQEGAALLRLLPERSGKGIEVLGGGLQRQGVGRQHLPSPVGVLVVGPGRHHPRGQRRVQVVAPEDPALLLPQPAGDVLEDDGHTVDHRVARAAVRTAEETLDQRVVALLDHPQQAQRRVTEDAFLHTAASRASEQLLVEQGA